MKRRKVMTRKIVAFIILICVFMVGCEYKGHKIYKIKTLEGEIISLSCPELDPNQSIFTYFYSQECYIVANQGK